MLTALAGLSTPGAAQGGTSGAPAGGVTLGLAYTVGTSWQLQALDVGYAHTVRAGPLSVAALTARIGDFIDQAAIIGGSKGFVCGVTLAGRTGTVRLADIGSDSSPTRLGADVTLEATGYAGAHSPLLVGSPWGAVSALLGLRVGNPTAAQYALVVGPTVFLGHGSDVRAFLGIRYEAALARGGRSP